MTPTVILLSLLFSGFAAQTRGYTKTDLIKEDVPERETALTPDDFHDLSTFRETDLKNILRSGSGVDLDTDPLLRANQFEGDIKGHNRSSIHRFIENSNYMGRNAIRERWQLWPNGEIPYAISSRYGEYSRKVIATAMDEYHSKTCIKFKPRDTERDYLYVHPDEGCYSLVGRVGGRQPLSLDAGCIQKGTVIHELMHSVGFFHEQSRADRDDWIDIKWHNLMDGAEDQFESYSLRTIQHLGTKYDYGSIMHYGPYAFSKYPYRSDGKTILPLRDDASQSEMGQRNGFSKIDIYKINKLYQCEDAEIGGGGSNPSSTNENSGESGSTNNNRPAPPQPIPCEDSKWDCFLRKTFGRCDSTTGRTRCRKTCGFCEQGSSGGESGTSERRPEAVGDCQDVRTDKCDEWKNNQYCEKYKSYMEKNCKATCRFCEDGNTDEDTDRHEPERRGTGTGTGTETGGTVDSCKDYDAHCTDWASNDRNYCRKYPTFMEKKCPASCRFCTQSSNAGSEDANSILSERRANCENKNSKCDDYASRGYCTGINERVMVKHCKKACGLC